MLRGRRSDLLLGGLTLVAVANGLLLGFSLYGLLAAALHIVHGHRPPIGYAWFAGAIAGATLLTLSLRKERLLRQGEHSLWVPLSDGEPEHPLVARFRQLVAVSSLERVPALCWIECAEANAFAVGRSRDNATIVVTAGLIERLPDEEMDAVLAQQLAHVELEDMRAVGLANAIAASIGDLARARSRFFWGPGTIIADLRPVLIVSVVAVAATSLLPQSGGESAGLTLLLAVIGLALLYAFWVAAKRSWRGLGQLFLFVTFFGPMSLVEAVLAPPTAILLSRFASRARVHEADARAIELGGDREALIAALEGIQQVEWTPASPWLAERRFSLFIGVPAQAERQAWLARLYAGHPLFASHPSVGSRIETIRALDRDG